MRRPARSLAYGLFVLGARELVSLVDLQPFISLVLIAVACMIVLYYGVISEITPPVRTSAYAAAWTAAWTAAWAAA